MRVLLLSVAVWVAAVAQSVFLSSPESAYRPNLPLLVALCGAWLAGSPGGAWLGFWGGLLTAALSGMFVGSFTFSYMIMGWLVGRVREAVYGDWPLLALPLAGVGTLLCQVLFFLWNPHHVWSPMYMLSQAVVNFLLAPLVYFPFAWLFRWWDRRG